MRRTICTCDFCGIEIPRTKECYLEYTSSPLYGRKEIRYDICGACSDKVEKFIYERIRARVELEINGGTEK